MKTSIIFKVYGSSSASKPLLERIVNDSEHIRIDFNNLFQSFRYLFGSNCVITVEYF